MTWDVLYKYYGISYKKLRFHYFLICIVHPCDTVSQGGCTQLCKKRKQKYQCACEDGFELGNDGKSCTKGAIRFLCEHTFILL